MFQMGGSALRALVVVVSVGFLGCTAEIGGEDVVEDTSSTTEPLNRTGILFDGQTMFSGDRLFSFIDPNVVLTMQGDCNLVLRQSGGVLWHSRTAGRGTNCRAVMQGDGNFVVSNPNGPVWWSGSQGHPGADLWLDADGGGINLFVHGPNYWKHIYPRP
jgi:hypothetical protein